MFHTLSWLSHESEFLVKSIGAAEILAAFEGIDKGKVLREEATLLLGISAELIVVIYSKELFTSYSTQRNSNDWSVRGIVNTISVEYEIGDVDEEVWVSQSFNHDDTGTKPDSLLPQPLQLIMAIGTIPFDLTRTESRRRDGSLC